MKDVTEGKNETNRLDKLSILKDTTAPYNTKLSVYVLVMARNRHLDCALLLVTEIIRDDLYCLATVFFAWLR